MLAVFSRGLYSKASTFCCNLGHQRQQFLFLHLVLWRNLLLRSCCTCQLQGCQNLGAKQQHLTVPPDRHFNTQDRTNLICVGMQKMMIQQWNEELSNTNLQKSRIYWKHSWFLDPYPMKKNMNLPLNPSSSMVTTPRCTCFPYFPPGDGAAWQ